MAYTTIDKPSDYFNTKLYTGTGNSHAITGVGFDPNWVWIKSRSTVQNHLIFDTVRGATKKIMSNTTDEEQTEAQYLKSFDSDGFTLGTRSEPNESGETFVSWNWKAGTSVSGNTTGSGTAKAYTGSVSTTAGFSIIKYLGNGTAGHTIPHHLGVAPKMIIVKSTEGSRSWIVLPPLTDGHDKDLKLNDTDAMGGSDVWNNVAPNSSAFSVGSNAVMNNNDVTLIAYCFAEKQGYSKFGSYTGNGNADGAFIYTGFKPAFFLQKKSSASGSYWSLWDNKRSASGSNPIGRRLFPNVSAVESEQDSSPMADFCSNGVKLRQTDADYNGSGVTYIYMAFAENPFTTSTGVPATAR